MPNYLPVEVIEHQDERIYPDHTTTINKPADISDVVSKCERERGSVVGVGKTCYARSEFAFSFEDWEGYRVIIDLTSGERIGLTLGPNMDSLVHDLKLQNPAELVGKNVSCYKIPAEFKEENKYLGISVEKN